MMNKEHKRRQKLENEFKAKNAKFMMQKEQSTLFSCHSVNSPFLKKEKKREAIKSNSERFIVT